MESVSARNTFHLSMNPQELMQDRDAAGFCRFLNQNSVSVFYI
jgi:hypothetical protein